MSLSPEVNNTLANATNLK